MAYLLPYGTKLETVLDELEQMKGEGEPIEITQQKLADKYGFLTWKQMRVHVDPPRALQSEFSVFGVPDVFSP